MTIKMKALVVVFVHSKLKYWKNRESCQNFRPVARVDQLETDKIALRYVMSFIPL